MRLLLALSVPPVWVCLLVQCGVCRCHRTCPGYVPPPVPVQGGGNCRCGAHTQPFCLRQPAVCRLLVGCMGTGPCGECWGVGECLLKGCREVGFLWDGVLGSEQQQSVLAAQHAPTVAVKGCGLPLLLCRRMWQQPCPHDPHPAAPSASPPCVPSAVTEGQWL